jgi:glutaminase
VGLERHPRFQRFLEERLVGDAVGASHSNRLVHFDSLDLALEHAEDELLAAAGRLWTDDVELELAKHEIAEGLDAAQVERLAELLVRREFGAREMLIRKGDRGGELLILVRGELSVLVDRPMGQLRRLSTLSPGMSFGELSLLDRVPRTAFVRADRESTCWVLDHVSFEKLGEADPQLKLRLLENMIRSSARIAARLTTEVEIADA